MLRVLMFAVSPTSLPCAHQPVVRKQAPQVSDKEVLQLGGWYCTDLAKWHGTVIYVTLLCHVNSFFMAHNYGP